MIYMYQLRYQKCIDAHPELVQKTSVEPDKHKDKDKHKEKDKGKERDKDKDKDKVSVLKHVYLAD